MPETPQRIDFELREDADSIFVPVEHLAAGTSIGDEVVVTSTLTGVSHSGRVSHRLDDDTRGSYFTVTIG